VTATGGNSTNWNTAYGWGNHASAGYLTSHQSLSAYLLNTTDTFAGNLTFIGGNNSAKESFINVQRGDASGLWLKFQTDGTSANNVSQFVIRRSTDSVDILNLTATNGNIAFVGTVTASGGNSTNWNTSYTYSQVGHLPLAGGTLTGELTTDNIVVPATKTIKFGASATPTFSISSSGTGTVLHEQGAGNFEFIGDNMIFRNPGTGSDIDFYAKFTYNGAAELYFDGTKTFETTTAGAKVTGDLQVDGNFTVNGTITTVNTEEVTIADNNIRLNGNFLTGIPTENAGISVRRGGYADVVLQWNEGTDKWEVTTDGSVYSNLLTAANFTTEFTGTIDGGTF